jgi:hypothetical protein
MPEVYQVGVSLATGLVQGNMGSAIKGRFREMGCGDLFRNRNISWLYGFINQIGSSTA